MEANLEIGVDSAKLVIYGGVMLQQLHAGFTAAVIQAHSEAPAGMHCDRLLLMASYLKKCKGSVTCPTQGLELT